MTGDQFLALQRTPKFPPPLSSKSGLLLLSTWIRLPNDDLHIMHAANSWLKPGGKVNQTLGPDCDDSPHSVRAPQSLDLGFASYFAVLFGPPKVDKDKKDKKEAPTAPEENQEEDKKKPSPEDILLTYGFRWTVVVQPPC